MHRKKIKHFNIGYKGQGKKTIFPTNVLEVITTNPPTVKYHNRRKMDVKADKTQKTFNHVHLGKIASGKTFRAKQFIKKFVTNKKRKNEPYKVLIIDHCNEYGDVAKEVTTKQLCSGKKLKSGVYYLKASIGVNGEFLIAKAVDSFQNGLLVIENSAYYGGGEFSVVKEAFARAINLDYRNVSTYTISDTARHIPSRIIYKATSLTLSNIFETPERFFVDDAELIQLALVAKNRKFTWEYEKIMGRYKRKHTIMKKLAQLERFSFIDIDLNKKRIMGIPETVFCEAIESFARPEIGNYTLHGMLLFAERINYLSKYRFNKNNLF